ncbi:MAG TPA: DUF2158 domain-containing protein [Gemmatimonadales bacterium]|nr:DUF2158 domain-containing protein [Gemmatimonadales bacterium]
MAQLKKGDEVVVKSGGPRMVVETIGTAHMTGDAFADCVWFEGNQRHAARFDVEVLVLAGPRGS